MKAEPLVKGALLAATLVFGVAGSWAFLDARSFYDEIALFPPYNAHFLHDAGAFQLGLAVVAALTLAGLDGLRVGLWGLATAAVMHTIAHAFDNDLGGRDSDVPLLAGLAALLLAAALAATFARNRQEVTNAPATQDPGLRQGDGQGTSEPR